MVAVAVSTSTTKLQLTNINPKYKSFECDLNSFEWVFYDQHWTLILYEKKTISFRIEIGEGSPEWYKYYLCGVKGVTEHFSSVKYCGMKVLISGNIPPASGLSSSSALVSAATLATSHANKVSPLG